MSYGKVINGGAQMRKGLTKGVNNKLSTRSAEDSRRQSVATAVNNAYKVDTLSSQHTNNVRGGKFEKPSVPKNI
jgi:hypothetical protein